MKRSSSALACALLALAVLGVATGARAQEAVSVAAEPTATAPMETAEATSTVDHRVSMWRLELGYRGSFVSSAGLDPFSTNGYLPQPSLTASRTVFASGRLSFAPGIAWGYGSSSATARGDDASLSMHHLAAPLEGRLHLGSERRSWGYAFVRVAPGMVGQSVELKDASAPAALVKNRWLFATDVSAGYAWLVVPGARGSATLARFWLQADGGYGFVARERLALAPDPAAADPRRASGVDLGALSTSGPFFRIAAAVSF